MHRRVVITGLGVIAPNGIGKDAFWDANLSGRSGIRRIGRFDASSIPAQIAGEVTNFEPESLGLTQAECAHMDRGTQFAIAAANLALQDANLHTPSMSEDELDRFGVYMGAAMASTEEAEKLWSRLTNAGKHSLQNSLDRFVPVTLLMTHAPTTSIAIHHQLHGPSTLIATGCSAGADAIGQAFWTIQEGRADRMLAGGTDSAITLTGINAFCIIGAVSTRNDEPERASRPYDKDRNGFVMAEGAGVILMEEREIALARGAHIYAEVINFTSNSNSYHMTALPEDGSPLRRLLQQTLEETKISPEQLDYINSHGSSTLLNEVSETMAYKGAFGDQAYHIPISATKSMIGHTQGAASAIETVVTTLVVQEQVIPPTINLENPDPRCDLDYVPQVARRAKVDLALTHSSGFGGINTALVLAKPDWLDKQL